MYVGVSLLLLMVAFVWTPGGLIVAGFVILAGILSLTIDHSVTVTPRRFEQYFRYLLLLSPGGLPLCPPVTGGRFFYLSARWRSASGLDVTSPATRIQRQARAVYLLV